MWFNDTGSRAGVHLTQQHTKTYNREIKFKKNLHLAQAGHAGHVYETELIVSLYTDCKTVFKYLDRFLSVLYCWHFTLHQLGGLNSDIHL